MNDKRVAVAWVKMYLKQFNKQQKHHRASVYKWASMEFKKKNKGDKSTANR